MAEKVMTGSCLCEAVAFEFQLPSLFAGHCHCSMCRRAHGAAYVSWVGVREDGFRVTKGQDVLAHYQSSDHLRRSFCGRCGASMLCNDDRHDNVIDVTLANIHGDLDRPLKAHIYYDCRAGWVEINDDLKKLGGEGGVAPL
jgi:hypothetical protein